MAVMAREAWTDERLDDLAGRMEKGFGEVKVEIGELRVEIGELRAAMDTRTHELRAAMDTRTHELRAEMDTDIRELRQEMRSGFDIVHARLDSMQRTMVICFATLSASIVASVLGAVVAAQL